MMGIVLIVICVLGCLAYYYHPGNVTVIYLPKRRWKITLNENWKREVYEGCGRSWNRLSDGEKVEAWKSGWLAELQINAEEKMGEN